MDFSVPAIPNPVEGLQLGQLLGQLINTLLIWAAAVTILFIIFGGFRFIISSGNAESVDRARQTVVYAILGMVIVFLAYLAVNYILSDLLQVSPAYRLSS